MTVRTRLSAFVALLACGLASAGRADCDIVYAARYYYPPRSQHGLSHSHLYRINPDGTGRTRLTSGSRDDYEPRWSPDGRWIAYRHDPYGSEDSVRVCDANGHHAKVIWRIIKSPQECGIGWSADSKVLLVTLGDYHSTTDWVNVTWSISLRDGRRVRYADLCALHWSPDRRHVYRSYQAYTTRALPKDVIAAGESSVPLATPPDDPAWLDNNTLVGFEDATALAPVVVYVGTDGRQHGRVLFQGVLPKRMAESDGGSWAMVKRVPGPGQRVLCSKSGGHGMGGGREHDYLVLSLEPPRMTWLCEGMELKAEPSGRYCVVGVTRLAPYGATRQVYTAPLQVGSYAGGSPRTIVGGLVWVEAADWRTGR
jgi:hypothetical protein